MPLSFDVPSVQAHELCLRTYDQAARRRALPIINSTRSTAGRDEPVPAAAVQGDRDGVGRVEDAWPKTNKSAADIAGTANARRCACARITAWRWNDIIIDLSGFRDHRRHEGLNRGTLEAVKLIGGDPELKGLHMMGGLSNIGQQLPPKAADGSDLKHQLENAFLTLAVPYGFDTVLGTPWRGYAPLAEDNYVLRATITPRTDRRNALRAVRKLYKA